MAKQIVKAPVRASSRASAPPTRAPQAQVKAVLQPEPRRVTVLDDQDLLTPEQRQMIEDQCEQYAGLGVSFAAADNIVPNIKVLQPMSPEVVGPDGVPDARAGDLLLRGAPVPLVPGDTGVWFQPCTMTQKWMRFVPREKGGGFVAQYDLKLDESGRPIPPPGAIQDPDDQFKHYFSDNGDTCTHYRFIPGIVWEDGVGLEYVLSFYGTGHSVARSWNTKWGRRRNPRTGKAYPACRFMYLVTTIQRTNTKGTWFTIETDEGHDITNSPDLTRVLGEDRAKAWQMGLALAQAFETGEKITVVDDESSEQREEEIPF